MNPKFLGVAIALAMALVLIFVLLVVLALGGIREDILVGLSGAYAAPIAGFLVAGWNRPQMFITLVTSAWRRLNELLALPAQRFIFLISLFASVPWFAIRVVGEAFAHSSILEYARGAYYPLANTIFEVGYFSYEAQWCDWLMLSAIVGCLVSIFWRVTVAPVAKWVSGGKS